MDQSSNRASDQLRWPRVDVVVSGFNEEKYIARCLEAVLNQVYPRELLSVVFVDGGSYDGTVEAARRLAAADPRLTVIADRGRLNLPEALNLALDLTTGELVGKVDAHGYPEPDYVRQAVQAFARCSPDVAAVGGRPEQEGETSWGQAVARARTSRFGTGGSVYASTTRLGFVDTIQCAVYRRVALDTVGCFDATAAFGEDDELNWRLRENGYRLFLDTSIRFHYVTRPTLRGVYFQYRNYGRAKVRVALMHPRLVRPWHLAPALFVVGWAGLLGAAVRWRAARQALPAGAAAYTVAAVAAAARAPGEKDAASLARVCACFAAIHVGYGTGMLRGLAAVISGSLRASIKTRRRHVE